jgi:hypothetical protein
MSWLYTAMMLHGCVDYVIQDPDVDAVPDVLVEERFVQAPFPDVDVLFVVDSTGSMADEQTTLADAAAAFVGALASLDLSYQIGVVTTDPLDEGVLLGRPWILTAADEPDATLAATLQVGTSSLPPAAGLYTATLALRDAGGFNRGFRRAGAGLHVIFFSDGDDQSDTWLGDDPVSAFADVLAAEEAATGRVARASAIVGDVPDGCRSDAGSAIAGERYAALADATGGRVESICNADLSAVAEALGGVAVEWPTRFALQARPLDGSVLVELDGERLVDGWSVDADGPALVFDVAPAADAVIQVSYTLDAGAAR